ncbi:DEAD/DEAH box helicase [Pseudomonas syringae]|uniref:DEAD/DEAH box helicase n=1 Tax=Pseudomonas syringae TaxID=317 RepID=UPI000BB5B897|nr:DEAD/DEAH box helicase [Pseudomonas syringae]MCK9744976.1 DEAD/DEAH box helicase [Pseudomonas syringae pv. syringae]MCK9747919.1 DEAD/DEAH box helicase [Pseudomonas syringae pv. syringae]MCK9767267.1 DEAD/DEAH box helicase [Pseudomonas syringae pv. syringae]PBP30756.1 helicase [Pseudomonas syringae]
MNYDTIKNSLATLSDEGSLTVDVLLAINAIVNRSNSEWEGRDLVIRALDKFALFDAVEQSLLLNMVRAVGLFPYITPHLNNMALSDRLAYEAHRVEGVEPGMVFHHLQAHVFSLIMQGQNVVLSASTSVGKSLVIDAVLAQRRFKKVVVIVPTIALIDETRRRLVKRFRDFNLITHPTQEAVPYVTNVYLLTQERVIQRPDLDDVEFFVLDEFYKIDLGSDKDGSTRAVDLSLAFHKLAKTGAQFYMLGPHIQKISGLYDYEYHFIPSDYSTVAVDVQNFNLGMRSDERTQKLLELVRTLESPTLIYCQAPASANRVAEYLIQHAGLTPAPETQEIAAWISKHYHPEWNVARAIALGIGIHHGGVPRALQQYIVKLFNEGVIKRIICTSTMIEGVNTSAENVIIYDRRLKTSTFDYFTYKNISGRAGRMNKYFIGKVFMLEAPPIEQGLTVEYPIGHQNETSPIGLLMQLENEYLTDISRGRLQEAYANPVLSPATLIENRHIPIERQVEVAKTIISDLPDSQGLLGWKGIPEPNQLNYLCELVYSLEGKNLMDYLISSSSQLAWHINELRNQKNLPAYLNDAVENRWEDVSASEAINLRLKFIRNMVCFKLPRDIMAIHKIQVDVLEQNGYEPGDFSFFAEQLENMFLDPLLTALDEYGIPTQISTKIKHLILPSEHLNDLLAKLRLLAPRVERLQLTSFEKGLMQWAVAEM